MENITRRGFVAGTAGMAGALAAASIAEPKTDVAAAGEAVDPVSVEECDIVVVGSGTAGTCAALRAAQAGAKVICLEKNGHFGGSSRFAEGLAAVGSKEQLARGIELDRTEMMRAIMDYQHYACSGPVVHGFLEESGKTIDWLSEAGVKWYDVKVLGDSYQTWHIPCDPESGEKWHISEMLEQLWAIAQDAGADMRSSCPMTGLVFEDGKVTGVYAEQDGQTIQINAKGVVLAGGGYANNRELFEKFTGVSYDRVYVYGDEGRDGDCISAAMSIGGATHKPGCVMFYSGKLEQTTTFADPINFLVCKQPTMRVNASAKRYFNEQVSVTDFSACGNTLMTNAQNFAIFDDDFITHLETVGPWTSHLAINAEAGVPFECRDLFESFEPIKKADTLEELGEALGIDGATLAQTVERFDGFCEAGVDEDYGLRESLMFPVKTPPFYGARVVPNLFTTVGGLAVDEKARVLDENGYVIDGLYATGGDAGSLYGACYDVVVCAGSQQGWAATSGRVAAEDILGL